MNHKQKAKTSSLLFTNIHDSRVRFGIAENGTVYSKNAQPAKDIFQRRMARLYDCKSSFSNKAYEVSELLLSALASGNEKIALHTATLFPLKKIILSVAYNRSIRVAIFETASELEDIAKSGVKAVIMSSMSAEYSSTFLKEASSVCGKFNIPLVADNTLTTVFILNPFDFGADLVIELSQLISAGNEKNCYITLMERNCSGWLSENNRYIRLFPFLKYQCPVTAYLSLKSKREGLLNGSKEIQAEYYMLCQGLKTLESRVEIHCQNSMTIAETAVSFSSGISYSIFNERCFLFLRITPHNDKVKIIKERLSDITVRAFEDLFSMYSCTAVYFSEKYMYVKAGTEPCCYLKQLFTI